MNVDQLQQIVRREPFRPFQIATTAGEHYEILEERDYLYKEQRPDLLVFFAEGIYRIVDVNQITSAAVL
jgi:hypothetical protein